MSTPRFLTPARVVMLALLELYVAEAVPSYAFLNVCSFLAGELIESGPSDPGMSGRSWSKAQRTVGTIVSIQDFEALLLPHMSAIGLPGRRLWDVFLKRLWDLNSLHKMQEFFEYIPVMLALTREEKRRMAEAGQDIPPEETIRFTANSPCGKFIRRCYLEFFRLRFHDVGHLWKEFVRYRQPTVAYVSKRYHDLPALSFDSVLQEGQHEWLDRTGDVASVVYGDVLVDPQAAQLPVSSEDAEKLLEFQVDQMQSGFTYLVYLQRGRRGISADFPACRVQYACSSPVEASIPLPSEGCLYASKSVTLSEVPTLVPPLRREWIVLISL